MYIKYYYSGSWHFIGPVDQVRVDADLWSATGEEAHKAASMWHADGYGLHLGYQGREVDKVMLLKQVEFTLDGQPQMLVCEEEAYLLSESGSTIEKLN